MEPISEFITQLLDLFQKESRSLCFEKGDFILTEGQIEKNLYLIESGAVRILYLTEFDEHTIRLGYSNSMINSISSYITQKPSAFYIEALRKSQLKALPRTAITKLIGSSAQMSQAYTLFLEDLIVRQMDREIDLLTTSPSQRLERVLQRSPLLFQEVPFKYIASYLRMTPETLSRLRKS